MRKWNKMVTAGPGSASLLDEIERDALDSSVSVATALRKCVALGGRSGSESLRDWATRELTGYQGDEGENLPGYRVIRAAICADGIAGNYSFTRKQFAPSQFPESVREFISEEVKLRNGVGELEELAKRAEVKISLHGGSELTRLFNLEVANPYQHVNALYWDVSPAVLLGVLDHIRTALTKLVAELRATTPREQEPTRDAANGAVQYVVSGRRARVTIQNAVASGDHAVASANTDSASRDTGWTKIQAIGAVVAGVAAVAGAVFAAVQVF